jgi:hypothetical protein
MIFKCGSTAAAGENVRAGRLESQAQCDARSNPKTEGRNPNGEARQSVACGCFDGKKNR